MWKHDCMQRMSLSLDRFWDVGCVCDVNNALSLSDAVKSENQRKYYRLILKLITNSLQTDRITLPGAYFSEDAMGVVLFACGAVRDYLTRQLYQYSTANDIGVKMDELKSPLHVSTFGFEVESAVLQLLWKDGERTHLPTDAKVLRTLARSTTIRVKEKWSWLHWLILFPLCLSLFDGTTQQSTL